MLRKRYHRDIGLPAGVPLRPDTSALHWTTHALHALREDGYLGGCHSLHEHAVCIEVTLNPDRSVWRWLLRQPLDADNDLCLVVEPNGTVVTSWTNRCNDIHRTLDRRLYATL